MKFFNPRQIEREKKARDLYEMIGFPSLRDYIGAVKTKMLNVEINSNDIANMVTIFGKNLGAIRGKTTNRTPSAVRFDYVEIPREFLNAHRNVEMNADIMFVNRIPFFVTVSSGIKYFTAERLINRKKGTLISAIIKVAALYIR